MNRWPALRLPGEMKGRHPWAGLCPHTSPRLPRRAGRALPAQPDRRDGLDRRGRLLELAVRDEARPACGMVPPDAGPVERRNPPVSEGRPTGDYCVEEW